MSEQKKEKMIKVYVVRNIYLKENEKTPAGSVTEMPKSMYNHFKKGGAVTMDIPDHLDTD